MSSYYMNENLSSVGGIVNDNKKKNAKERPKRQNPQIRRKREIDNLHFLDDFEPEKSIRERRKLKRKVAATAAATKDSAYDEFGRMREFGFINICDCMNDKCSGCFYPCPNCNSTKCGPICRVNRKNVFEFIEFDGKDAIIKNKYICRN